MLKFGLPESRSRSLMKALSYRFFASLSTALIVYGISSNIRLSLGAGALDVFVKLALYFVHERIWSRIALGGSAGPVFRPLRTRAQQNEEL